MASRTEIKRRPSTFFFLLIALGVLVGIPVAAVWFDDPSRLLWLGVVPLFVALGVFGHIREPLRIVVDDGGIELAWLRRRRKIDVGELAEFVTPKREYLLGEGLTVRLKDGTKVELANDDGRVLEALRHHFPQVPYARSDRGYLTGETSN